jgi:hypothetical protein
MGKFLGPALMDILGNGALYAIQAHDRHGVHRLRFHDFNLGGARSYPHFQAKVDGC